MADHPICDLKLLPRVGEECARAAYEKSGVSKLPWDTLIPAAKDHWESIAMAAVAEYKSQLAVGEVNDRWHEGAVRELVIKIDVAPGFDVDAFARQMSEALHGTVPAGD